MPRHRTIAAVLLGFVLIAVLLLALPVPQWRSGRLPAPALSLEPGGRFADRAQRLWIDTDAACGSGRRTDPDDCFALLMLLQAEGVEVAGISTVFGNASRQTADRVVHDLLAALQRPSPPVYAGSTVASAREGMPAHAALRDALTQAPLTIVALGPLTNIAAALHSRPQLQRNVERIVAVMGRRPGHWFHPSEGAGGAMLFGHGPIFSDLNMASDATAVADLVRIGVPLVLVPYDAARRIEWTAADLERMRTRGGAAAWVAERAQGWLEHWREDIGRQGFYPFDLVGAAFALRPDLLLCARVPVRVGEDTRFIGPFRDPPALLVGPEVLDGVSADATPARGEAVYCPDVVHGLHDWLLSRLVRLMDATR